MVKRERTRSIVLRNEIKNDIFQNVFLMIKNI